MIIFNTERINSICWRFQNVKVSEKVVIIIQFGINDEKSF